MLDSRRAAWLGAQVDALGRPTLERYGDTAETTTATTATRPHQIEQTSSTAGAHQMTPHYDEAGNIVGIDVDRTATCSAPTGKCAQRFLFEWDEVGQLTRARRWDLASLQDDVAFPAVPTSQVSP